VKRRVILSFTLASLLLAGASACTNPDAFKLTSDDNNPQAIAKAFQVEKKPTVGKPINSTGKPLAFMVTVEKGKKSLLAWDVAASKQLWTVQADVSSRVVVGGSMIAAREGNEIVARDVATGKKLWGHALAAKTTFLGAAADNGMVFYVQQDDSGGKRTWELIALGSNGEQKWQAVAPGTLGAPAARGGLVYMPFLTQWLTVLDASTGTQLARIREEDEAIDFVRTTSDGVFYGSKGVFVLDDKSVSGTRKGADYGAAKLPDEFVRTFYHWDAFQPVQAGYSAYDRNRILWRASAAKDQGVDFKDDRAVVFTFRFFFGFDAKTGELVWAHNHPRNDIVSADDVGDTILYVSSEAEVGALDMKTGAKLFETKIAGVERVTGATFDADGYRPKGDAQPAATAEALASIVWDKDKRFNSVKLFALNALGTLKGPEVTTAMLKVLLDPNTPQAIFQRASEVLIARKDPAALPQLIDALKVRYDFITGTKPRAVDVIARAIGALGDGGKEAVPALLAQYDDPETPATIVKDIADSLGAIGSRDALPALRAFLLVYRSDPMFSSDTTPMSATIDALLKLGGGEERELLSYVAEDERTDPKVAEYAKRALAQTAQPDKGQPEKDKK
jgi:outer membrane protein assembly factor BamB